MKKKFHLAWFGSVGPSGWQGPSANLYDWRKPEIYQDVAKLCERAKFDMVLYADTLAVPSLFRNSLDYYVKNGFMVHHDPVPTIAMMAAVTSRIGLATTMSSTFYPPFLLARLVGTLDHLSGGRFGWNVVTTATKEAAQNFGMEDLPDHDVRYDMADEFLEICRRLWDSWAPDAVVQDRQKGIFAEPSKVRAINFKGKFYSSKGPLNVVSSPQKHPVIIMAGTSPRGQKFAIQNAEMVIAHKNTIEDMRTYSANIRKQLQAAGRAPDSIKVFFSIKPVLGDTEQQAKDNWERHLQEADEEHGLADLSTTLGHDMSRFPLDEPLPADMLVRAIKGKVLQYEGRPVTLREIGKHEAAKETIPIYGTPEQVADILEQASVEGGGDGFHFRASSQDINYLLEVTTKLVPILQRRGLVRTEYTGRTLRDHLFEF